MLYFVLRLLLYIVCVCIVNCVYCTVFSVLYYTVNVVQELFKCVAFTHELTGHETCIYMIQDLAMEDSYIIHEDNY